MTGIGTPSNQSRIPRPIAKPPQFIGGATLGHPGRSRYPGEFCRLVRQFVDCLFCRFDLSQRCFGRLLGTPGGGGAASHVTGIGRSSKSELLGLRDIVFRVPFWGSVNPSPLGDGMRSIRNDANVEVGESYDMGL